MGLKISQNIVKFFFQEKNVSAAAENAPQLALGCAGQNIFFVHIISGVAVSRGRSKSATMAS